MAEDDGVSPVVWVIIALSLLLLLLCCLAYRRLHNPAQEDALSRMDDDTKSQKSGWSAGMKSLMSSGAKTYETADPGNLALQHSKLDVHKCKSALCKVCSPNLGKVNIIKVKPSLGRRIPSTMACKEAASAPKTIDEELPEEESTNLGFSPNSRDSSFSTPYGEDDDTDDADSTQAGFYDIGAPGNV